MQQGEVAFTRMEKVIFGQSAAEAVHAEAQRIGAERVFLLVSGTLNRETDGSRNCAKRSGINTAGPMTTCPPTPLARP